MAISIKHPFISLKGDGGDATLVRPSNWNAAHTTSISSGNLVGRLTAGVGSFEEIAISAFVAAALNAPDGPSFLAALGIGGFVTGDVKFTVNPNPVTGWIAYQGTTTLGKTGSTAVLQGVLYQPLYEMLYNSIADAYCPVSGGRTGNATTDFNAGKTITTPWFSGRAIIGSGGGGSLTTRANGSFAGAELHTLDASQMPSHYHVASIYDPTHTHSHNANTSTSSTGGGAFTIGAAVAATINASATGVRVNSSNGLDTTYSTGGGGAHNNMQPYTALWVHVKL